MDLQAAAKLALANLERKTRNDGKSFVCTQDDAPEWVGDLCREAHSGPPEDYRYECIEDALYAIAENEDEDDAREQMENGVDVYNGKLAAWLAGDVSRGGYVDEAAEEMGGEFPGIYTALQWGQARERVEVLDSVRASLQTFVDDYAERVADLSDAAEGTPAEARLAAAVEAEDGDTTLAGLLACMDAGADARGALAEMGLLDD